MRAEEQTESNKRLRQRAIFLATAFILAGILAMVAAMFWQNSIRSNKLATSRELSAAAVNNLQIDPERSALLALQALDASDTLEARNALRQSIPEMHLLLNIPAHSGGVPDVAYSPDGKLIAKG
jgi:Flp pilus assembly protein TadB